MTPTSNSADTADRDPSESVASESDPSELDPSEFDPSEIVFVTRDVTDSEIAAVTAVVRGLLREESEAAHSTPESGRSAWELGQRALRKPVHPGPGAWRGFPA